MRLNALLAAAALSTAALPGPAPAHPHVFIDVSVGFLTDADGRLSAIRVEWLYDPLFSLFVLDTMGVDPSRPLDDRARAVMASDQARWIETVEGHAWLFVNGAGWPLDGPETVEADFRDGRIWASMVRPLRAPARPNLREATLEVYDPGWYTQYVIVGPVTVEGPGAGRCEATLIPYAPDAEGAALQSSLAELGPDESPQQGGVGRLFADRARLTCA